MQDGRRTRRSNRGERVEEERDPTRAGRREPPGSRVRRSEVARSLRGSSKRYTRWLRSNVLYVSRHSAILFPYVSRVGHIFDFFRTIRITNESVKFIRKQRTTTLFEEKLFEHDFIVRYWLFRVIIQYWYWRYNIKDFVVYHNAFPLQSS